MRDLPLLVAAPLVGPILRGEKTETRRLPEEQPNTEWGGLGLLWYPHGPEHKRSLAYDGEAHFRRGAPADFAPWKIGDRLWVRETWRAMEQDDGTDGVLFPDGDFRLIANTPEAADAWMAAYDNGKWGDGWRPSIHMPRWASRITLLVTDVRVERVQEITEEGAKREGIGEHPACDQAMISGCSYRDAFRLVWDSLADDADKRRARDEYGNLPPPAPRWADNPWVWVVAFDLVTP